MSEVLRVYIGYDAHEPDAFTVAERSIRRHASIPLDVFKLDIRALQAAGLYRRNWLMNGAQRVDQRTREPVSTEFTFTRYLIPALTMYQGRALFFDIDFLFRADVAELVELFDRDKAVMVVKHEHVPPEAEKMRAQAQYAYYRKNWSSLILWNCSHAATRYLTPYQVNSASKQWLHAFSWLDDSEIGELPIEWNWLEGYDELSSPSFDPKAVHYTRGTPQMPGYENSLFADEWRSYLKGDRP